MSDLIVMGQTKDEDFDDLRIRAEELSRDYKMPARFEWAGCYVTIEWNGDL